ncbi:p-loop containing nucleoside triphosphate hydrolase [Pleurostoma richardsiae]|uniref:P-loop containing nucleoside triphosphate hydrolase n=1 Tax=Pleurostoma richardsiae TaxID=41990 RepID=A0AA38RVS1_9PEZI|nr:p-loop containing nucleoside triphosphate hydrolase [Pleurostoma richardsiae]
MDPYTALSLAASVVAFVDFTAKLLSKANEIRKDGSSVDVAHLNKMSAHLIDLSTGLRYRRHGDGVALAEEVALEAIALDCANVADELARTLNKLTDGSERGKVWPSIRAAFKTMWHKDEVEQLTKRLDQYRQEMSLRLLVTLNKKADLQSWETSERLRILENSNQKIVEIVTFTGSLLEGVLIDPGRRTLSRREGAISAILALDDGTTRPLHDSSFGFKKGDVNTSTEDFAPLARQVLLSLHYRMVHVRMDSVSESYKGTFNWILESPTAPQPWDSFSKWLQRNGDCYWITGKAGSGKSTLMKYILSDKRTVSHLKIWTRSGSLIIASYFFWAHGTSLQKTQEGLLRGLLGDVLKQCQYLIPEVFPDIFMHILRSGPDDISNITLEELRIALRKLARESKLRRLNICLFIDGLDEYGGDLSSLCQFLFDIARSSEFIKIVFSSRPWNIFEDKFALKPKLRLEQLTRPDIHLFACQTLDECWGSKDLESLFPGTLNKLVDALCQKAAGVFLWVVLAVRALCNGVINADTVPNLMLKLDELPEDLEEMYRRMFQALKPEDQAGAARMILMLLRGTSIQTETPVSLLQMALAEEFSLDQAIQAPVKVMLAPQRQSRCELMKRRLQARTSGLLEVVGKGELGYSGSSSIDAFVAFFHRTAADFFQTAEMWELLASLTRDAFDPDIPLLASCLYEIKVLPVERAVILDSDRVMIDMRQLFAYTLCLEVKNRRPYNLVLDELKRAMNVHWSEATSFKIRDVSPKWEDTRNTTWLELWRFDKPTIPVAGIGLEHEITCLERTFLCLAISMGCVLYAADKALGDDRLTKQDKAHVLEDILWNYFELEANEVQWPVARDLEFNYITAASSLLQLGADPNLGDITTPWTVFLGGIHCMDASRPQIAREGSEVLDLFRGFVQAGANVNLQPALALKEGSTPKSVLSDLKEVVEGARERGPELAEFKNKYAQVWDLINKETQAKAERRDLRTRLRSLTRSLRALRFQSSESDRVTGLAQVQVGRSS